MRWLLIALVLLIGFVAISMLREPTVDIGGTNAEIATTPDESTLSAAIMALRDRTDPAAEEITIPIVSHGMEIIVEPEHVVNPPISVLHNDSGALEVIGPLPGDTGLAVIPPDGQDTGLDSQESAESDHDMPETGPE